MNIQVYEARSSSGRFKPKKTSLRHYNKTVKNQKQKVISKAAKEKRVVTYMGTSHKVTSTFFSRHLSCQESGMIHLKCGKKKKMLTAQQEYFI